MSFRKRNVVIGTPSTAASSLPARQDKTLAPGVRPSPLDGRPTTSTGTPSLDQLLAGHNGFPLGTSLLIQEAGATDFGGTLLRYFAAEGLVQGHHVHLLGYGDAWRRELPGLDTGGKTSRMARKETAADDKMKIAWRYEALGNASSRTTPSRGQGEAQFCHSFDLAKRLESSHIQGKLYTTQVGDAWARPERTPFKDFLAGVAAAVKTTPPNTIHRIIVPGLLSPALYPSAACRPQEVLQFLHGLRALLRRHPSQITALVTLPVSLFPRSTGLNRWMELLSDGVLELIPLQHQSQMALEPGKENKSQGLLRAHSLPVFHEKGGGLEGSWSREDLSFKLSASSGLVITPYSLPPVGEEENASATPKATEGKKDALEF
ncbi:Elongator complex protein-like protein [Hapsidospora chrysogenum ATCC 11550]|uniref:Elongator complex protein 4 n=1 Tax=Hapsidospora chrysogenum (strain ATCC 11550 / CBS 779.69 / DSM 880 / IAM 14645 / JCM 23072 / IMI 49137) TaxID=857340 RepID=A0A086SYY8_HAPC1|nr:Elongator complex protein-like protein [Hapsidospora chrysogenum ATCC 11550]